MITEVEVGLDGGRVVHGYVLEAGSASNLAVCWFHGTPNVGAPPEPLFDAAHRLGLRWFSYDRPGYGGSTANPDRDVASAAADVASVADALGIERFAVVGHSGGGPHALACAALLPKRVACAVSVAGLAPFDAAGLDWFEGMAASGVASLQAAARGRAAKEAYEASGVDYDPEFIAADEAALAGEWSWLGGVVGPAVAAGPGGLIDDDLAYVRPWGFDPAAIKAPVLLVHGRLDRVVPCSHSQWLLHQCQDAELWLASDDGHISALGAAPRALAWLRSHAE